MNNPLKEYNHDKYYLIVNDNQYEGDNIKDMKKNIKEGKIPKPSNNEKVMMINFGKSTKYPLMVVIGQYTLTPKGALTLKDDDISTTLTYDKEDIEEIGFNKEILKKIINAVKNDKIDYSNSSMPINKIIGKKSKAPINKGNVMKARSDIKTTNGKRHVHTDMIMQKNLSSKEKRALHKSILKAVSEHLKGSGIHIPLHGNYTSSLIFHEMGKYISPKDRKLMQKLIDKTTPPPPPPVHSGAISSPSLAIMPPLDYDTDEEHESHIRRIKELNDSDSETDEEHEAHMRRIRELNDSDSDTESESDMEGEGIKNKIYSKHLKRRVGRPRKHKIGGTITMPGMMLKIADTLAPGKMRENRKSVDTIKKALGGTIKRPRGRPRKIVC
jgi:hypothetical protein